MTDLKLTIIYSKTISDGNYGSEKFGLIQEFDSDTSVGLAFMKVKSEVDNMIRSAK